MIVFRNRPGSISFLIFLGTLALYFTSPKLYSQQFQSIDLALVPQKKVRNYIEDRQINSMKDFTSIHASWKFGIDESAFQVHEKEFYVTEKLSKVWDCYKMANPVESWNGRLVRFAMLISKCSNTVSYSSNCDVSEVDTGQVYFLDLRLLKGLFNVPVAFEIITIDPLLKIIEFSYIDGNKSEGKQTIQFFNTDDGNTRIVHRSYFKSSSHIRDGLFYPYFHNKIIKEFHENMLHLVQKMNFTNQ